MIDDAIPSRFELAQRIVEDAGGVALEYWRRRADLSVEFKASPQDVVSEADRAVERHIRSAVSAAYPDDGFLGEEFGETEGLSGYLWVIDPIDGTSPFLSGQPNWCVAVAVWYRDTTVIGVIGIPTQGEIFAARVGHGAMLNGRPLLIPAGLRFEDGQTGIGSSHRSDPTAVSEMIRRLMERGGMFFRNGSGAMMLAYVAAGRLVGYFEPHMHAWDCLAGLLLVQEAGGRVEPYCAAGNLSAGGLVLATAPQVWEPLRAVIGGAP